MEYIPGIKNIEIIKKPDFDVEDRNEDQNQEDDDPYGSTEPNF